MPVTARQRRYRRSYPACGAHGKDFVHSVPQERAFRKVVLMAKKKRAKREDGRMRSSFTFNGKRYFVYGFSEQELKEKEIEKRSQLKTGVQDHVNPTLNCYYERFTEHRRSKVKESTIRSQSFQFRNCADVEIDNNGMTLGDMRIRDIKPYDLQKVQQSLEKSKRKTETVNNCMDHLKHVFNAAVRDETIDRNPCRCIEHVKRTEKPARDTIHRALSEEETAAFFQAAKDSYYFNACAVMVQTGIRVGELAALMAVDVDIKGKTMHINKTVTKDETGAYVIGDTPKTDAGNRDIPINDQIIRHIRDQRSLNRIVFSDKVEKTIFRSPEGALLREYTINREIARICKRAEIDKFTCHAFRATFATRFIEQRPQDYKVLSEVLGHSNTKITLDLYTHVMTDRKVSAMEAVRIVI